MPIPLLSITAMWKLVSFAALAYAAACVALLLLQNRMIFFPAPALAATPAAIGLRYEDVWLDTEDGERVHGWWLPGPEAGPTVLFLHGNAGNISHRLDSLRTFAELGASILIIDYRGYGQSDGSPSEQATYLDADAAWRYLVEHRGVAPERIVVFGRSLGGAIAIWLASTRQPGALIAESSFTSVPDLAAGLYPIFPVRLLARVRYPSLSRIGEVSCPVLVAHSPDDELIPYSHGRALFERAGEPKTFLEMRGGHNDGFIVSGELYEAGLRDFMAGLGSAGR